MYHVWYTTMTVIGAIPGRASCLFTENEFPQYSVINNPGVPPMPNAKWSFCDEVQCKVMDEYMENWKAEVTREHSRTTGLNKLRQYKGYKKDFGVEEYVNIIQ
jgi:hypothetical protein